MVRCKENLQKLSSQHSDFDSPDGALSESNTSIKKNHINFSLFDAVGIILSVLSFLFDTGMDIAVAYLHYTNGDIVYFILTLIFIIVPALTMTCFSIRWYIQDLKMMDKKNRPSRLKWIMRGILLAFQLGPLLRYIDSLMYAIKGLKTKDKQNEFYYQKMIFEDTDAALLRLFEAFMEAAPQLVLQIYILVKNSPHESDDTLIVIVQGFSIFASLFSLSWALAYYHRSLRISLPEKQNISWKGTIVQLLWQFFVISARVLSLGLLATLSPIILGLGCFFHWMIMTVWIITMKTTFCETRYEEIIYNAVLGVVFIFCYFNPIDKPTRYRYSIYYAIMFMENTIMMILWYIYVKPLPWFHLAAILIVFLSFFIGIFFMILYYLSLHPTGKISVWKNNGRTKYEKSTVNQNIIINKDVICNSQV